MIKRLNLVLLLCFSTIYSQGITNTLGGNSDADRFIIENQGGGKIFTATGIGTVGIGVVNPAHKFDVNGTANMLGFRMPTGANSGYVLTSDGSGTGTWQPIPTASADNDWTISGNDLIMAQSGKVGIGTATLGSKLNVYTNSPSSSAAIYCENAAYGGKGIYVKATYSSESNISAGFFEAFSNPNAQGLFARGSKYGIHTETQGNNDSYGGFFNAQGYNSTGAWGAAYKYGVRGLAKASSGLHYGGYFETTHPSGRGVYATNTTSSGTAYGGVFEAMNSSDGVGVYANGKKYDFHAAGVGVDYHSASSIRWKKNVKEIDNPLEKIAQLRGVYFDWDEEHGGTHDVGCIAEEVGKILPEIVTYEANGIDAEGMDYSKLTPLLIEAIKALEKRVAELEAIQ